MDARSVSKQGPPEGQTRLSKGGQGEEQIKGRMGGRHQTIKQSKGADKARERV